MTSGTAAGGVFVCRKMLRNAKIFRQVSGPVTVAAAGGFRVQKKCTINRKIFLTSAWTAPRVSVVGRWKIEPVGIPFFSSRAIFDFLAGRF